MQALRVGHKLIKTLGPYLTVWTRLIRDFFNPVWPLCMVSKALV